MKYEDVVYIAREAYENADARHIFEHIAIQVNIVGEGAGSFYIEVAQRAVCVEPYDYYDRDGMLTMSADTVVALTRGELGLQDGIDKGLIRMEGNEVKIWHLASVILPNHPRRNR